MSQSSMILGLRAQTSIHAGTGQQTGIIDLPIQREGHNGWPCIFGSAVKGALRANAEQKKLGLLKKEGMDTSDPAVIRQKVQEAEDIAVVYGPSIGNASEHAGAVMVSDARLLLFPVRSLTSQFKWVTCPDAIQRYGQDTGRLGLTSLIKEVPCVVDMGDQFSALIHKKESVSAAPLFLEEYRFQTQAQDLTAVIDEFSLLMGRPDAQQVLQDQLVIVSDDSFTHLTRHATPVNAHISIDSSTKTVNNGALWYEETLPPETLLYTLISASDARRDSVAMDASKVLSLVLQLFSEHPWLQLGGNETVGMGWCAATTRPQEMI